MQIGESVAPPALGLHDDSCPFCEGKDELQLRNYKTKHGALKDEDVLGHNLGASGTVTADRGKNNVGNVYPLSGGDQPHDGWTIREQVLMEFEVWMKATPHHLIPGKASMRLLLVTARALSRPPFTGPIDDAAVANIRCVSPPIRPAIAGPAPPL